MNYLERIARRATGQASSEGAARPRVRTLPDGPDPVELAADDVATSPLQAPEVPAPAPQVPSAAPVPRDHVRSEADEPVAPRASAPAGHRPSGEVASPEGAGPGPERVTAPVAGPDAEAPGRGARPELDSVREPDRPREQASGEARVVRVERRLVREVAGEVAAAPRRQAERVVTTTAGRSDASAAPPAERSVTVPKAPDPAPAPVQSLDDLLGRVPGQSLAQPAAAPKVPARPSVTIGRVVVEVTPPAPVAPPAPRRARRRRPGATRPDTDGAARSRLRYGLGQS